VVIAATLLATLATATTFLNDQGWEVDICQVQVSRSRPLGRSSYLQALNPVWLVTGTPREAAA
jgi:precorrin-6B methylase 2